MPPMTVVRRDDVALVRVVGDVDVAVSAEVEAPILGSIRDAPVVVLDLSAVSFLDSAGLRLVDHVVGSCERRGVQIRVVAPEGSPARLPLRLCGFPLHLIAASAAEALAETGRRGHLSG